MQDREKRLPTKVSVEGLRSHFRKTYRLADDQVELMLESSAKSLQKSLTLLYQVLDQGGSRQELEKLGHSMKGLLLNMGEQEWADVARELELSAAAGEERDYSLLVRHIHQGVEDVLQDNTV